MKPLLVVCALLAGITPASAQLKQEMRAPWSRSNERFIRRWLVLSDIPGSIDKDYLQDQGGESAVRPAEGKNRWHSVTAWGDAVDLSDGKGLKRDLIGYAFTTVNRKADGKALLCIGSDESIRVWLNGVQVLDRRTRRQLTFDEDQVEVDMKAGDNALLVKLEQHIGPWVFSARVLEPGAIPPRIQEIGPSIASEDPLVVKTDINKDRAAMDKVTVQVIAAGGTVRAERIAGRGDDVRFYPAAWPDGPYEFRFTTHKQNGLLYATHIPWYKGDAIAAARKLVAAPKDDITIKMLADLVLDRLGGDLDKVTGNPWWAIHSPLMEYEELKAKSADRPFGFVRLAWRDPIDNSPQFCRAYLPPGYDRAKKWPLVLHIHGYNPANPEYVRWWSVDARHLMADIEYANHQGIIYMEPHGRGNTTYLGLGDQDIVRVIRLAKQRFSVDDDRVYLVGDSMGGWGTWNVATRHPELFGAIAPIYGGSDYHSERSEDDLGKLKPLDQFLAEKQSSWSMAEGLLQTPILVTHGDVDKSVNVDFSRYGVRMLERWGYNIRYVEMPGYGHEDLNAMEGIVNWFLQYKRNPNPMRVRLRSAELQNASAYWVRVDQAAAPNEFVVVDAEITGPHTIRVDTQNVLAFTLSPPLAGPVNVVWNGKSYSGSLSLRAPGYEPASPEKNSAVAGPLGDIYNTPFAIVTGTASTDPAMNEICRRSGQAAINAWKSWQRQPPRAFLDSELNDADAARYSLVLIGGPDANLVTRRLATKLPLEVAADHVKIGNRSFPATDARVQMIHPNPLNPERYVLVVAATSPGGMFFWSPGRLRNAEFDFTIEDGHLPGMNQRNAAADLWVAGGWFDRAWQLRDDLVFPGDAAIRAKAQLWQAPKPGLAIDAKVLDSYVGSYALGPGFVLKVSRDGPRLMAQPGDQQPVELVPVSDTEFLVLEGPVKVVFEKDPSGAVTCKVWLGPAPVSAKRVN